MLKPFIDPSSDIGSMPSKAEKYAEGKLERRLADSEVLSYRFGCSQSGPNSSDARHSEQTYNPNQESHPRGEGAIFESDSVFPDNEVASRKGMDLWFI